MCKDMKKIPNSPPNRLPNSPHPLKKVKKSTSQQVNRSTSCQRDGSFGRTIHYLSDTIKGTVLLMVSTIIYLITNIIPHLFPA